MTPFAIRLELLKMAKEMLEQDYHAQKDALYNDWSARLAAAQNKGEPPPSHPIIPPFPTASSVIEKAKTLNAFVSNE